MIDSDLLRELYTNRDYEGVIRNFKKTKNDDQEMASNNERVVDEWSYVFLARSYYNLGFYDEAKDTISIFKNEYKNSVKLDLLQKELDKKSIVYTVGYSSFIVFSEKQTDKLIEMMKKEKITCLVDVRSFPKSKQFPLFDDNEISNKLNESGLKYYSLKDEFGARRVENNAYSLIPAEMLKHLSWGNRIIKDIPDKSQYVDFEKVYLLGAFKKGFEKIKDLMKEEKICFMCSETHPWDCHRCIMVSEYFRRNGFFIKHIVADGIIDQKVVNESIMNFFEDSSSEFKDYRKQIRFGISEIDPLDRWDDFFKIHSFDNAIKLKNIQIGYKK